MADQKASPKYSEAVILRDEGQFRLRHTNPNDHIWKNVHDTGAFYEAEFLEALGKIVKPGELVLDVGANIGNHSVFFAGVCQARVVAFEPNPEALVLLRENISANALRSRVEVRDYALGSEPAHAEIDGSVAAGNLGAVRLTLADDGQMKIEKLDDVPLPAAPKLIKIDAEGMDIEVLRGAEQVIRTHQPIVAVEAGTRKSYNAVADFLDELGYIHRESFNYTPTHIFEHMGKAKISKLNRQLAREVGGNYVDMALARANTDARITRLNARMATVEGATQRAPAETEAMLARNTAEILATSRELLADVATQSSVEGSLAQIRSVLEAATGETGERIASLEAILDVIGEGVKHVTAEVDGRFGATDAQIQKQHDDLLGVIEKVVAIDAAVGDVKKDVRIAQAYSMQRSQHVDSELKLGRDATADLVGHVNKVGSELGVLGTAVRKLGADLDARTKTISAEYRTGGETIARMSTRTRELQAALARLSDTVAQVSQSVEVRFYETNSALKSHSDSATLIKAKVAEVDASLGHLTARLNEVGASVDTGFSKASADLKLASEASDVIRTRVLALEATLKHVQTSVAKTEVDVGQVALMMDRRFNETAYELKVGLENRRQMVAALERVETAQAKAGEVQQETLARLGEQQSAVEAGLAHFGASLQVEVEATRAQLGEQRTHVQADLDELRQVVLANATEARAQLNDHRSEFEAGFGDLRRVVAENFTTTYNRIQDLEQASLASDARVQGQINTLADASRSIGTRLDAATTMIVAGQAKLFERLDRIEATLVGEAANVRSRLAAIEAGQVDTLRVSERMEADILAGMEISARMGLWVDNKVGKAEEALAHRIDTTVASIRAAMAVELQAVQESQLESVGRAVADIMIELDRRQPATAPPAPPPHRIIPLDPQTGGGGLIPSPKAAMVLRGGREVADDKHAALPEIRPVHPTVNQLQTPQPQSLPPAAVIQAPQPPAVTQVRGIDLTGIRSETLANVDLSQVWTNLGWAQSGASLAPGGVVNFASGAHWPGFVTARVAAKGGGVINVTVTLADCPPGANLIARIRNDKDEQCGPDFPLSKGVNTFRVFAPQRSESLKAYVLVRPPTTGGAFTVKSLKIERLDGDSHQRAVRLSVGQPVLASMASIPSRRRMLADCINSLLAQCDRVRVFLNNYPDVPDFLNHPRIDVRRSQDWDDRGDAGKVHWIDRDKEEGYRLVTDDDLLFPPDFSETMCSKVQAFNNRAIFCTHGVLLRQPVVQYYDPDSRAATFHFARQLDADTTVHIGATNAMCFHSSAVQMKWNDYSYCNSADIWISLYAQRNKLPVLAASRLQGWVRENTHDVPEDTIYNHSRKRTKSRMDSSLVQDAALRHAAPLTLQPTHRPKLGLAIVVEDVGGLKIFLEAWTASRSSHVDWVLSLIPAASPEKFRAEIGQLLIEHETHLFDSSASLRDRIGLARRLAGELGIQATLFVPQQVRFAKAGWEGAAFSPAGINDGLLVMRDAAGGQLSVSTAGAGNGGKAFVERSVSNLALPHSANGTNGLRLEGAPSQLVATTLADVFAAPLVKGPAIIRTDRAPSGRRINDMFERVVVLNLDRRPDRWAQAQHQLAQAGIKADRFSAVDGGQPEVDAEYQEYSALPLVTTPQGLKEIRYSEDFYINPESQMARIAHLEQRSGRKAVASRGAWGYLKSYRAILEQAMKDQVESLLVFDDDMLMHRKTEDIFAAVTQELPKDWLLLQLGTLQYNWKFPWFERASEHLYRTRGSAIGSHAVGIRFDMMPFLLDHASRMDMPFDVGALSAGVHAFPTRSFVTLPNLAIQRLGAGSDISTSDYQKQTSVEEVAATYRWNLRDYFDDKAG